MKIYIIGNITLDIIIESLSDSPVWGTEVFINSITHRAGGNLLNIAFPLKKLGLESSIIGNIGNDTYGKEILENIRKSNLSDELVKIEKEITTSISYSLIRNDGERFLITYPGQLLSIDRKFIEKYIQQIEKGSIVVLASIFQLPNLAIPDIIEIFKNLRKRGCITLLDPGWDPQGWKNNTISNIENLLKYTDYFLPNLEEARSITNSRDVKQIIKKFQETECKNIIIKKGKEGSIGLFEGKLIESSGYSVKCLDTTGAGDAFNAGIIYSLNKNIKGKKMLEISNAVASYVISKIKNRYPTFNHIKKMIS